MARAEIPIVAFTPTGDFLSGASVYINLRSTGTATTVYNAETGTSTLTQPLTTDTRGRIQGWVERGSYEAQIVAAGFPTYVEPFEAAPAGDGGIDAAWLGTLPASSVGVSQLAQAVRDLLVPIGAILPYAGGGAAPTNYLICDGREVDAGHTTLNTLLGSTYGTGSNGRAKVPDLRGRAPIGADNMGGVAAGRADNATIGLSGGTQTHALTEAQMPQHNHGLYIYTFRDRANSGNPGLGEFQEYISATNGWAGLGQPNPPYQSGTNNKGSSQVHPNMQPFTAIAYIIRAL